MDELLKLTLLYDFYGELLTEKQKQVYEFHYQDDMSFSEIGEELSTTRQAVRDLLKRTEKILFGYEEKLHLVERFLEQKKAILKMKTILDEMSVHENSEEMKRAMKQMQEIAEEILD